MIQSPHNPDYKLIGNVIKQGNRKIEFVYGISNSGNNEGMEVYFYRKHTHNHFYTSRRYTENNLPKAYTSIFHELKTYLPQVKEGHKLTLS